MRKLLAPAARRNARVFYKYRLQAKALSHGLKLMTLNYELWMEIIYKYKIDAINLRQWLRALELAKK